MISLQKKKDFVLLSLRKVNRICMNAHTPLNTISCIINSCWARCLLNSDHIQSNVIIILIEYVALMYIHMYFYLRSSSQKFTYFQLDWRQGVRWFSRFIPRIYNKQRNRKVLYKFYKRLTFFLIVRRRRKTSIDCFVFITDFARTRSFTYK